MTAFFPIDKEVELNVVKQIEDIGLTESVYVRTTTSTKLTDSEM